MASASKKKTLPEPDRQPREIELKLELASGSPDALLDHPALAQAQTLPGASGNLNAVYYDTDDQALRKAGISLRVRRRNSHAVQTIKAEQRRRGIAIDRGEWETPVEGGLDFAAAEGTALAPLVPDEAARQAIRPVFTVETERRAFEVECGGSVIEMALDRARITANGRSLPFSEIELELKQGDAAALFLLARDLSRAAPLRLAPVTKSERGYRLLDDRSIRPFRADKIELPADASCAEAFQIIARSCLSQIVLNEPLVRQLQDPEALHQMRVGLRRLRAVLSLFKGPLLAGRESAGIKEDLRWAGRSLGTARDLDVLLGRLRSSDEDQHCESHLDEIEKQRADAYESLLETLESRRFMDLFLRTAAWIEAGDWTISGKHAAVQAREHRIADFTGTELTRRWKRIRRLAKGLRALSDEERHGLRIRIKKLRYGAEFFGSLFPADRAQKRLKKLSTILSDLQDTLGELNDLAVGHSLVPSLPAPSPECAKRRRKKLLARAETAAGKLDRAKPFWL